MRLNGELTMAPAGTNRILVEHQPIGVGGAGDAVEFPRRDGGAQDRAGAGGGLHLRAEARDGDAAHRLR